MGSPCCAGDEFQPNERGPSSVFVHPIGSVRVGEASYSSTAEGPWAFCTLTHEALLMQGAEGRRAAAPRLLGF